MNRFYIGDKVKIIKEDSIFYGRKTYITNFLVDVCKFLVDFGTDVALFHPWELELVESKEDIDKKLEREKEKLYSALKTIQKYCQEHTCGSCPLKNKSEGIERCFNDINVMCPARWNLGFSENKNENG